MVEARSAWWARLPALTQATISLYTGGAVLMLINFGSWTPGMSPRWLIGILAMGAIGFAAYSVHRGVRLTAAEAKVMLVATLFVVGLLTWLTQRELAALTNGVTLPLLAPYVVWFMHPVRGRVLLYAGCAWWFAAVLHHGDDRLAILALTLVAQVVMCAEIFVRIRRGADRQAQIDPLTGVFNRRLITDICRQQLHRLTDRDQPFSVLLIDLDGLREVNNRNGHHAGDALLVQACDHWRGALRPADAIGRIGGDEFLIVVPGADALAAALVVERIRVDGPVAWSVGVAQAEPDDTVADLLRRADERMYLDKFERARLRDAPQS